MAKQKIVSSKNLPTKLPLTFTLVCAFLLDYYNANGIIIGATSVFLLFLWIGTFLKIKDQEEVNLF